MINYEDWDIRLIENDILLEWNRSNTDYKALRYLLKWRKNMLNKQALEHQEELLPYIIEFNDVLTKALRDMYDHAQRLYEYAVKEEPNIKLDAHCILGGYPKLHPYQADDREDLWDILCEYDCNPMYEFCGVSMRPVHLPSIKEGDSFESLIGMDCPPPNWNEGLDRELTKDLHLTSAFNHLFEDTNFALTDFIFVREFYKEISMEVSQTIK